MPKGEEKCTIQGNRIVELGYILKPVIKLQYEHSRKCTFGKLKVKELRRGRGLNSKIIFECIMCQTLSYWIQKNQDKNPLLMLEQFGAQLRIYTNTLVNFLVV